METAPQRPNCPDIPIDPLEELPDMCPELPPRFNYKAELEPKIRLTANNETILDLGVELSRIGVTTGVNIADVLTKGQLKLYAIIAEQRYADNEALASRCEIHPHSVRRVKASILNNLYTACGGTIEPIPVPSGSPKPTFDELEARGDTLGVSSAHGSCTDAVRALHWVLKDKRIDTHGMLPPKLATTYEGIIAFTGDLRETALQLGIPEGNIYKLCQRIIVYLSHLVPPDADLPLVLVRPGASPMPKEYRTPEVGVGQEIGSLIFERALTELADRLHIGQTMLRDFVRGDLSTPPSSILETLLGGLELDSDRTDALRARYTEAYRQSISQQIDTATD